MYIATPASISSTTIVSTRPTRDTPLWFFIVILLYFPVPFCVTCMLPLSADGDVISPLLPLCSDCAFGSPLLFVVLVVFVVFLFVLFPLFVLLVVLFDVFVIFSVGSIVW